jgi:hypothetical protein
LLSKCTFDDGDAFIAKLLQRLDAMEYLKQHEVACLRRYRYAMLIAFEFCLVLGGNV